MDSNSKIAKIWFDGNRIFMQDNKKQVYSRLLEAFPLLLDADTRVRDNYTIDSQGDAVRWSELDEDIHISSFYSDAEPNPDNEIARLFKMFPQLNVSEIARQMGINKSLLAKYIYGIKTPSEKRKEEIRNTLHELGRQLIAV